MSDWKEFSIGEIADPKDRYSFSGGPFGSNLKSEEYTEGGVRIIQLQNIGDGQFKDEYKIYTSEEKADELISCNIYPGEIILSKMGNPVARATFIPETDDRYLMASDGIRLKVDGTRFDSTFILNAINSPQFRSSAETVSVGSTRKRIGLTTLKELTIYAPPLPEQKKIAEILSGIDTVIILLDAKIRKLNLAKSSVSEKEFAHATLLQTEASENSLQMKTLREVADVIDCKHRTPTYTSEGFPVVRPRDVKESGINFDQCIKTSADEIDSLNDGINPQINDIVYSRNATLGVGALIKDKTTFAIGQDVCILRSKAINFKYFYYQLNSTSFFRQVENLVSGSTFKRINLGAIRELQVITPDTSEQERVACTLERIDNSIASLQRRREKNTQLKTSLAQDLLSGRKRVSDARVLEGVRI